MAEGARLESVYTLIAYRGFESLSLRQILKPDSKESGFFVCSEMPVLCNTRGVALLTELPSYRVTELPSYRITELLS